MRHVGYLQSRCLSLSDKPVPAERHLRRVLLPMVRVQQFRRTLQTNCASHPGQEGDPVTEKAEET